MKIAFFSTQPYDRLFFERENTAGKFNYQFYETHLGPHIVRAVERVDAVCVFVNDKVNREVIAVLAEKGVRLIALRCAGFNNVDLAAAKEYGISVCRVPAYSPEAVAEHTVAMLLTLNRKTHKAYNRVREQNFSLNGLLGFNLHGRTVGVVGTGKIGKAFCRIMRGFGCRLLAFDLYQDDELVQEGLHYVPLDELYREADILSLHCPLTEDNKHMLNKQSLGRMKDGVIVLNTSRGGLIDTVAVIEALKSRKLGGLAIDVYEQEEKIFFRDLSNTVIEDDTLQRLMSFPNVLITAHQAFFTDEALGQIARTTLANVEKNLQQQVREGDPAFLL
ncbi:2-hydroxyacid dehydrogenase [Sphingobacterium deserti]|uniref:NAD-binding D-isomer specific 2-hydroxyacid dehydrogenase n=1 Tax=Sphingobacterium deserti TaxID=1229276 RepID=A0A0B8T6M1_9SPHI|nr:2-hydroxyacid dehydrogenase [Sphingobacterium deserti]KGE13729.1 NAD-binding D-isomer specific 2-hydroxyacid dehydrogenase [Sphingobacterium deserti]